MKRSEGSAVVDREQAVGYARSCDRASTAGSGNKRRMLIAGRWPTEAARWNVVYGVNRGSLKEMTWRQWKIKA